MDQNAQVQRLQAETTSTLIDDELKQSKDKMDALDALISKFKSENQGRLPEQFTANVAQLQSLQIAMGNANAALKELADAVVASVDEDGFAEAVERYVLERG